MIWIVIGFCVGLVLGYLFANFVWVLRVKQKIAKMLPDKNEYINTLEKLIAQLELELNTYQKRLGE